MKKLVSCILVGTLVLAMLLSGCSNSTSQTQTSSDTSTKKSVDGIQYGQILSVSDSEIVLALGTMDNKGPSENSAQDASGSAVQTQQYDKAPQGNGDQVGTPPQGKSPSGDNGGTPPSGDDKGNPPSGGNPPAQGTTGSGMRADGFGKSMIELTGDKLTLTVSDKTTISYMKNHRDTEDTSDTTAKISDLKEGDIIAVALDEDGKTALEITIMSMRNLHDANATATAVSTE